MFIIIVANVSEKSVIHPSISKNTGSTVLPVFLDMVVQVLIDFQRYSFSFYQWQYRY